MQVAPRACLTWKVELQPLQEHQARAPPHWYAYGASGGRRRACMQTRYISRASATASPKKLRAIFELRRQRRAEAAERKRRCDTRSGTGSSKGQSQGEMQERSPAQAGTQKRARLAPLAAQAAQVTRDARAAITADVTTAPKTIRSLGPDPHR